ncbi:MAG: alpha/beta fold hydrolase [Gammaproteobacteria bacterium]
MRDGRDLAFSRYGRAGGRPLYFFHGLPGSRLQAALLHAPAAAGGVCLIGVDRPGFGRSTPAPRRTILDWPVDIAQLADRLGHARFGVLGVSCGGPYALACAHRIADRLDFAGLLAGMGPMDVPELRRGQLPVLRALFALAQWHPALIAPVLLLDRVLWRSDARRAVRGFAALLTAPDRALFEREQSAALDFGRSLAEAYNQGIGGAMREVWLIGAPRGFRLEEIAFPVHLYQGGDDRHVPPAMAQYMAARLPNARLRRYAGDGHVSVVVNAFPDCLGDFLAGSGAPPITGSTTNAPARDHGNRT